VRVLGAPSSLQEGGGGGLVVVVELCVLQVLCQTYFATEFLHCSVCFVSPVIRVCRLPKFVLMLGPEIS
jgi:hypothetical protein